MRPYKTSDNGPATVQRGTKAMVDAYKLKSPPLSPWRRNPAKIKPPTPPPAMTPSRP